MPNVRHEEKEVNAGEEDWTGGRMEDWTGGRMEDWTDGQMEEWTLGQLDGWGEKGRGASRYLERSREIPISARDRNPLTH